MVVEIDVLTGGYRRGVEIRPGMLRGGFGFKSAEEAFDRCVVPAIARSAHAGRDAMASQHGANVFLYSFEQGSALHAQELDYVFGDDIMSYYYDAVPPSAALTASVQRYWRQFALRGDPNGAGGVEWPRYAADTDRHLVLVDPPRAGHALGRAPCQFWHGYFEAGGTMDLR